MDPRYRPYSEEMQRLRAELDARWQRFSEADADNEPEYHALAYEVLASDCRMQGLVVRAQREMEIARIEAETARMDADAAEDARRRIEALRGRPVQLGTPVDGALAALIRRGLP